MKRIFLSVGVILTFIAYSFQQRGEGKTAIVVAKPKSAAQSQTPAQASATNSTSASAPSGMAASSPQFKDGTYTGSPADAYYGFVQVQATISGGKITDVQFLQHPSDQSTSQYINSQAMPYLQQEAIQAQNAQVNIISGATDTSMAFIQSLTSALNQAKV